MTHPHILALVAVFATLVVVGLAGAGLAGMPPDFAVSVVALPIGLLVAGAVMLWRRQADRLAAWSARLGAGLAAGLAATLAYNLYRVGVRLVFDMPFDPFRVQPVFGQILTGLPSTHAGALVAGWSYHLWIGAMLGMVLAALRPRGGLIAGALFASAIQLGRWAMYPAVFRAGLVDNEFFANGVIGILLWGMVLGITLAAISRRF
jgi:hypothetical protein